MKRFLLSLVAILISSLCFAQDVIVKKDGGTILSRVVKVGNSVVEYKKFEDQEGASYIIGTHELQCINYENGTKDTFMSSGDNPDIVTNETVTKFSNDKELLEIYKKQKKVKKSSTKTPKVVTPEMSYKRGKRMKIAGYTVGGTLLVAGLVSVIIGHAQDKYKDIIYASGNCITDSKNPNYDREMWLYMGYPVLTAGVAVGLPLILKGSSLEKKNKAQVYSASAISHDIELGNGSRINLGIDVLSSNFFNTRTAGVGVRYNF